MTDNNTYLIFFIGNEVDSIGYLLFEFFEILFDDVYYFRCVAGCY